MPEDTLRILAFGAHPDDCDIKAGGLALLYAERGHCVRFVSTTNGATGHHEIGGIELARRRYEETQAVARLAGIEYHVLDNHTGELEPTVTNRKQIIRIMREFRPDLILTHRPNDYHPDHRYTSQLVQDASYIVTVPNMVPLTPHLQQMPVIAYFSDGFQKPLPFTPDVAVGIDAVLERKIAMLDCHVSQMYEWLPYNGGYLADVPAGAAARRDWLARRRTPDFADTADRCRELLAALYGPERAPSIHHAEAFESSEYGARLTPERRARLFPFFG
jgi:N-acetylglucosamine malate deacetylase 1